MTDKDEDDGEGEDRMLQMNRVDWFSVFKYLVYAALVANVVLFFKDDWEAAAHVFRDGLPFARIIEGFAPSIDTAAWVILLLLFELETCQLSDEMLTRPIGRAIRGLRALCYVVIVYAFTGYLGKALGFGLYVPADIPDACTLAMKQFALLVELDEYRVLTAGNCAGITGGLFVNEQTRTLAEAGTLIQATRLAWVDVVNSGTWLLILALLELDVRPDVKRLFPGWFGAVSLRAKCLLYAVIAGAAVYWGLFGTFLDFWDAFLWIAAFIFIERNVWKSDEPRVIAEEETAKTLDPPSCHSRRLSPTFLIGDPCDIRESSVFILAMKGKTKTLDPL